MITPISTSPAPMHKSTEKLPRQGNGFPWGASVGAGCEGVVPCAETEGLGVDVPGSVSSVAVDGAVVAGGGVSVLVSLVVGFSVGASVAVGTIDVSDGVVVSVVGVSAVAVAVCVEVAGGEVGTVGGGEVGFDVGFAVGGEVAPGVGVRVGIVCREGFCPGAAHSSGQVVSPMIDAARSASSMPIRRLITPSLGSIVPRPAGVSRLKCI